MGWNGVPNFETSISTLTHLQLIQIDRCKGHGCRQESGHHHDESPWYPQIQWFSFSHFPDRFLGPTWIFRGYPMAMVPDIPALAAQAEVMGISATSTAAMSIATPAAAAARSGRRLGAKDDGNGNT